jgi:hypothetical protein
LLRFWSQNIEEFIQFRALSPKPIVGSQKASDRLTLAIVCDGADDTCNGDLYLTDGRLIYKTP